MWDACVLQRDAPVCQKSHLATKANTQAPWLAAVIYWAVFCCGLRMNRPKRIQSTQFGEAKGALKAPLDLSCLCCIQGHSTSTSSLSVPSYFCFLRLWKLIDKNVKTLSSGVKPGITNNARVGPYCKKIQRRVMAWLANPISTTNQRQLCAHMRPGINMFSHNVRDFKGFGAHQRMDYE